MFPAMLSASPANERGRAGAAAGSALALALGGSGLDAPAGPFGAGAARQVEPGRLAVLAAVH